MEPNIYFFFDNNKQNNSSLTACGLYMYSIAYPIETEHLDQTMKSFSINIWPQHIFGVFSKSNSKTQLHIHIIHSRK
jgi:hypothetical protein